MNITIAEELKEVWPGAALGILEYEAEVTKSSAALLNAFDGCIEELSDTYEMEDIAKIPHIDATRKAYKALGKNPSEYRNAAEAMLRRVVKSSGLYHINCIVEVNNLISIRSGYSIGSYDVDEIRGQVVWKAAEDGAHYAGIGKNSVNIGHIPTLHDDEGAFGNPSSDSQRAMIKEGKHRIMTVLYAFDGAADLAGWLDEFRGLLEKYCGVSEVRTSVLD